MQARLQLCGFNKTHNSCLINIGRTAVLSFNSLIVIIHKCWRDGTKRENYTILGNQHKCYHWCILAGQLEMDKNGYVASSHTVMQILHVYIISGAHEKKCRQERATPTYLIEFRVQALSSCVAILRIPNSAHGHFTRYPRYAHAYAKAREYYDGHSIS